MKFSVEKNVLLKGIEVIQNVIASKGTLPILSNILIETQHNNARLTATDLNIGISCVVPVNTQEQGAITVPARRFGSIIKEITDEKMEINTKKNNTIIVETTHCQFKILGLPSEEFPKLPEFKDKEVIKMDQSSLKQMLNLTSFAVSIDESRHILNGILFKIHEHRCTLVATDGKRLAIISTTLKQACHKEINIIIPIKTILELNRNLQEVGDVSLIVGANQVLFDFGGVIIISRLIEGEFPDYQQVVPAATSNKIKINREQFLLAVKRASLLATPDYQAVKLEVFKDRLVISKSTPDIGESREEVLITNQGKEIVIGFNPSYLIDVLKNLIDDTIEFELAGSEKPGVIRTGEYVYIVLPMRLG